MLFGLLFGRRRAWRVWHGCAVQTFLGAAASIDQLKEAASQMVLELGDCGEEAVDGGVASAAAADMAVTTADTPAATAAAVAAEDGEAAVDVARLGRARALLVAGAKFSGTIDIPGIHDGVDEESLYEARCATHHIPPPTHTHQRSAKSYTATPALQEPSCMLHHYYFSVPENRLYCVPPLLKKQKNSPAPAPPLSRTYPDPLVCARTTHFILWISGPKKTTRRRFTSCTIYFC